MQRKQDFMRDIRNKIFGDLNGIRLTSGKLELYQNLHLFTIIVHCANQNIV